MSPCQKVTKKSMELFCSSTTMESVDKFWCRRNNPSAILKKAVIAFHNDVDVDGSVDGQDDDDHDDDDDDVGNDDFLFFGRKTQNAPIEERSRK